METPLPLDERTLGPTSIETSVQTWEGSCRVCKQPFQYRARVATLHDRRILAEAPQTVCSAKRCIAEDRARVKDRIVLEAEIEASRIEAARAVAVTRWIPPIFRSGPNAALDEHIIPELQTWTYKESVFLWGPVGVGKTHQIAALMQRIAGTHSLEWYSTRRLIGDMQATFRSKKAKMPGIVAEPTDPDVLVLSDFTATRSTIFVAQELGNIVDARYHAGRPIIIDDNHGLGEWVGRAGDDDELGLELDRIASRISAMTTHPFGRRVEMLGKDRRISR